MIEMLVGLFEGLWNMLSGIGAAIIDLVNSTVYMVKFAAQCVLLLVQILWQLLNLLFSFGQGLLSTIGSVTASNWSRGEIATGWDKMAGIIPLSTVGWVIAGLVWIILAAVIVRAIGAEG